MAILYASGASWNTANNWGTTTGATDGSVPTSADDVIFDANSVSMAIDTAAVCKSINTTGYTATLTQNTTQTLVVSGNVTWAAGTFAGGDAAITINGGFALSGGAFTSTSATLTIYNPTWGNTVEFIKSGGTFTHNSGTVKFAGYLYITVTCTSSFNHVIIDMDAVGDEVSLLANLTVAGDLTVTTGYLLFKGKDCAVTGTFSVAANGRLKLYGNEASISTPTLNASSYVVYTGNSTTTIHTAKNWSYGNLQMSFVGAAPYGGIKLGENHTELTRLTVDTGIVDLNGFNVTTGTDFTVSANGTLRLQGGETASTPTISAGGTVEYTATSGTITCKNWTYKNLTFNGSGGTFKFGEAHTGITTFTVTAGTFDQSAGDYAITCTSLTVNGGTFTGGTTTLTVNGNVTMSSGTFTGGNQGIIFSSDGGDRTFTITGTVFTAGSSTVQFYSTQTTTSSIAVTGTWTFNSLTFLSTNNYPVWNISSGSLTVTGTLTASCFGFNAVNTGTIYAQGNISLPAGAGGERVLIGSATLVINGAGDQTITVASGTRYLPGNTTINKATGTLNLSGSIGFYQDGVCTFTYTQGTVAPGTSTVVFNNNSDSTAVISITGNLTLYGLTFYSTNNHPVWNISSGSLTATGALTSITAYGTTINTGTIYAQGNVVLTDPFDYSPFKGTAAINFNGTADQIISVTSGSGLLYLQTTINKAAGKVTLAANLAFNATGQDLICTLGTLDLAGYDLAVNDQFTVASGFTVRLKGTEASVKTPTLAAGSTVVYYGDNVANTKTCKNWSYKNLTINDVNANLSTFRFGETHVGITTFTITGGTFSQSAGDYAITCTGFTVNGGTFTGGATALTINGAFSENIGSVTFGAQTVTLVGNFTYTTGTFDAGSSTMVYYSNNSSNIAITGSHTLNNLTIQGFFGLPSVFNINIEAATTVTVNGALVYTTNDLSGVCFTQTNTGTIAAKGNITFVNGPEFGGTGTLLINGSGVQTLTGNNCYIPSININCSGTLNLSGTIYENRNWTYTSGTLSPGSSTVVFGCYADNTSNTLTGSHTLANVTFSPVFQAGGTGWNLNIAAGTTLTVTGTTTFTHNSGACYAYVNTGTLSMQGNIAILDYTWGGTAVVKVEGAAAQSWTQAGIVFYPSVTINKTVGTAVSLASTCSLNTTGQDLTVTSGTLDLAGFNLAVNDQFTVAAAGTIKLKGIETCSTPTLATGSTVVYYGDNVSNTKTCKNWTYKNLTIADLNVNPTTFKFGETHTGITLFSISGGTFSQALGDYAISCQVFNQTGGTFAGGTAALGCAGNWDLSTGIFTSTSGVLTLTGFFTHTSGTFNHNNGTVTLNGAGQGVTGSTTFYNFIKNAASDTLSWGAGGTYAFANNLDLQGVAGGKLNLRSTTPGTAWLMTFPATRTLRNLDWLDVQNTVAANPVHVQECSRSGKTYGLIFPDAG